MNLQPKTNNLKSKKGFTLIELVIVAAMMALIATISLMDYRAAEKRKRASLASDMVINALRSAQNFTLTGKNTTNTDPACRVPEYYYVSFVYSSTLGLFAKNTCNNTPDTIETYTLPASTTIAAAGLKIDGGSPANNNLSVAFYPPFGAVKAKKDSGTFSSFTNTAITVTTTDGITRTVNVDGIAGRIGE